MNSLLTPAKPAADAAALTPVPAAERVQRGLLASYVILTKARLTSLVLVTTGVGYVAGMRQIVDFTGFVATVSSAIGRGDWRSAWATVTNLLAISEMRTLAWTMLGTALAACAASVLNQLAEVRRDAAMNRTKDRPLPRGDISSGHAFVLGIVLAYLGASILGVMVNGISCVLAVANILLYVLVYTPMKTRTTLNTLVGAVCGALPPMIGWSAATGGLEPGAWVLGGILFIWQIPHFLALAWMYREDYARGGYRMLPRIDADGHLTTSVSVLTSLLLAPVCLAALVTNVGGFVFAAGGIVLTLWLTWLSIGFYRERTVPQARKLFFGTIVHLTLLMVLIVIDPTGVPRPSDDSSLEVVPVGPNGTHVLIDGTPRP